MTPSADTDADASGPPTDLDVETGDDPAVELAVDIAENPETVTLPDGRELGYADVGDPDGDPLLVCHGFPNSRVFGALFDAVGREQGVRVLAPERPGFGVSTPDPDRELVDWPTDVAALAGELGLDSFPVLGVSAGCPYAVVTAALSDRVERAGVVAGLAPMDSVGVRDRLWYYAARYAGPVSKLLVWLLLRQAKGDREAFLAGIADDAPAADERYWTGTMGTVVHASMLESSRHHGLDPLVRETALFGSPWGFDLGRVDVPTALWYGEGDSLAPPVMGEYLAARIPDADLTVQPDRGHLAVLGENEADIVDWLRTGESTEV